MKSHYKFMLLVVLTITQVNCKQSSIEIADKEIEHFKEYVKEETYSKIETDGLSLLQIIYPHAIYADGSCGIILIEDLSEVEFNKTADNLLKKSLFNSPFLDTVKYYSPNIRQLKKTAEFPVPQLDDEILSITKMIDANNSFIYGLRQEYGSFFKENFLNDIKNFKELEEVEDLIGNGFSNGAIVDKTNKKIIYWILVW